MILSMKLLRSSRAGSGIVVVTTGTARTLLTKPLLCVPGTGHGVMLLETRLFVFEHLALWCSGTVPSCWRPGETHVRRNRQCQADTDD